MLIEIDQQTFNLAMTGLQALSAHANEAAMKLQMAYQATIQKAQANEVKQDAPEAGLDEHPLA